MVGFLCWEEIPATLAPGRNWFKAVRKGGFLFKIRHSAAVVEGGLKTHTRGIYYARENTSPEAKE